MAKRCTIIGLNKYGEAACFLNIYLLKNRVVRMHYYIQFDI